MTLLSLTASFGLVWIGLTIAQLPRSERALAAAWASVPWNSALLAQIAYVGYLLLPVEVLVSIMLLRRRSNLSYPAALSLVVATRVLVFLLLMGAAAVVRARLRL